MAKYELFQVEDISRLKEGVEDRFTVRDLDKFETRVVKAIISSKPDELPDGEELQIRRAQGQVESKLWAIKVLSDEGPIGMTSVKDYL
ncbi:MAG: hypothetical protein AUJ48_02095 [Deltaproteobacteria bacterium CG1_02_45_11]|nr:MAG: hypothetical protein AUJ48_02095 [Deltaproteobacteria bacterium CG1_02_45_11]